MIPSSNKVPDTSSKSILVSGVLLKNEKNAGTLLQSNRNGSYHRTDPFLAKELIKRFKIPEGAFIEATAHYNKQHPSPKVKLIKTIDGEDPLERRRPCDFGQLTSIPPENQFKTETDKGPLTTRVIDLFCPIGKGTRGLIVAPPRTGKTTLLQDIASGILKNHPECHVMVLLVDERPEEVTDFKRSVPAEIFASSNDEDLRNHIKVAQITIERAKRMVENGKDVLLLIDSITRLSRAYNSSKKGSGRTMSGGLDARALEKPRKLFSAARNTEEAGSLTIIASALIETGSRMDDLIFQEFKGTGNMEMVLNRKLAELRLWPAIDIKASGTRREEMILDPKVLEKTSFFRRAIAPFNTTEATETTLERMGKTDNNESFLRLLG